MVFLQLNDSKDHLEKNLHKKNINRKNKVL